MFEWKSRGWSNDFAMLYGVGTSTDESAFQLLAHTKNEVLVSQRFC